MKNKVLIKLTVPEIGVSFDLFVPVNEIVWKIKKMLIKSVNDLSDNLLDVSKEYVVLNKDNCNVYENNTILLDTDIRNSTELLLISNKYSGL